MTEPKPPQASPASRRDFLKTSTAATIGLGMMTNAHAAGSDSIKVGLVGCGGRGRGAAENICDAAGTSLQYQALTLLVTSSKTISRMAAT